ncbi:MAG: hypothetical protein JWN70_1490 [Planctomycetaceae bacterium]|nr:hypothetical protein [Planctomycetaceae bacterium]
MVRSTQIFVVLLSLACLPIFGSPAQAQGKKGGEFIPGTVVSIEKEKTGKNYKMKIKSTADDAEFDVPLKPATRLAVIVKGDDGFLRPNVTILTEAVTGNMPNQYTGREFTVFVGAAPPPQLTPDPKAKGVFALCGKVLSKEADGLTVQCGPQPLRILFEGAPVINVKISDAGLIKEGDAVEVEGTLVKSKKTINAITVNVTAAAPLNADEYFAALEERTGKKSKTAKSKTAKAKTEGAEDAAGAAGAESDPFGVNKKKGAPKTKAEKAAETEAKKDEAKKAETKDGEKPAEEKKAAEKKE